MASLHVSSLYALHREATYIHSANFHTQRPSRTASLQGTKVVQGRGRADGLLTAMLEPYILLSRVEMVEIAGLEGVIETAASCLDDERYRDSDVLDPMASSASANGTP